jgi:AhpD family alkylhydroperoxidase
MQKTLRAGPSCGFSVGMTSHYHDENDLKLLKEMKALAPEEFKVWAALDGITGREDGKIPRKYRELIAIAVAHTTQCVYCIEVHTKNAKKAGASKEEVAEAVFLAAALRAGGAAAHGTLAMKFYDQA